MADSDAFHIQIQSRAKSQEPRVISAQRISSLAHGVIESLSRVMDPINTGTQEHHDGNTGLLLLSLQFFKPVITLRLPVTESDSTTTTTTSNTARVSLQNL